MPKIVTNRCYGGYGLSHDAILRYAELAGIQIWPEKVSSSVAGFDYWIYWTVPENQRPPDQDSNWHSLSQEDRIASNAAHDAAQLDEDDIERDDPHLVAVVEEMGDRAGKRFSALQITEIPDGVEWQIEEYDGREWVAEKHRVW